MAQRRMLQAIAEYSANQNIRNLNIKRLLYDKKMYEDKIKNLQGKIAYAENFIGEKLDTLKTFDKQEELSLAQQELSFLKTDQKAEARNKQLKIVENLNSQINLYQNQMEKRHIFQ